MNWIDQDPDAFKELILAMRDAYARGENVMDVARQRLGSQANSDQAILVSYDLQAGSYVAAARKSPEAKDRWCRQLAELLTPWISSGCSILEVGCGEATTLAGVMEHLPDSPGQAFGLDISWSRCHVGQAWLQHKKQSARLFVGDLFDIPLADGQIDVVYTSHSIEPNGGKETDAIRELVRVARRAVVCVEPIYELASAAAQERMRHHGYVRGLKAAADSLGAKVDDYRLLPYTANTLNPSGALVIDCRKQGEGAGTEVIWRCPLTHAVMQDSGDAFVATATGMVYPVLRNIPLLRKEHAVVASGLHDKPT